MKRMKVGKYYKIVRSYIDSFAPELSPQGTIVKCIEDCSANDGVCSKGLYKIKLIDNCGKKLKDIMGRREFDQGWLFHVSDTQNEYRKLSIKEIRKLKIRKLNNGI